MILEEVGLGKVVDKVRDSVEGLARQIYPDLVGPSGLDSAKAFTVEYDAEEEAKDKELSTHFDNAEVCFQSPFRVKNTKVAISSHFLQRCS